MKVVLLLLCLVLIQIFSARAEDQNTELSRDASVGMGRQVREAGQKVKNKSSKKGKKGKKNGKVSRTNKSKPRRKKKSKKANGRKNKSKPRRKKKSKKANGRKNKSKPRGKKKSKKANGRKNKSNPRGQKKSKKANGRKNKSNPKGKKKSKKANGRKNSKGGSKGKKRSKNRRNGGKSSNTARQNDTECLKILCEKSKKNTRYLTQMRKANRIERLVELLQKKKDKAMTTFKNASSLIASATLNGTQCAGGPIPEDAKVAYETLQNCSTTASELCDSSTIPGLNTSLITECLPLLKAYVIAYKGCTQGNVESTCDCSCLNGLTLVKDSCTNFNDMENNTKIERRKCTNPTVKGSFSDCRQQERKVAHYVEKCKACPPSMTTKAPSSLARQFQRLAGRVKN